MVLGIKKNISSTEPEGRNHPKIDLHSSAVSNYFLLADKLSEPLFQVHMDIQCTVKETGA